MYAKFFRHSNKSLLFKWDYVNRRVFCFAQEAVDDRAFPENFPARARGLAEDDVSYLIFTGKVQKTLLGTFTIVNGKLDSIFLDSIFKD